MDLYQCIFKDPSVWGLGSGVWIWQSARSIFSRMVKDNMGGYLGEAQHLVPFCLLRTNIKYNVTFRTF